MVVAAARPQETRPQQYLGGNTRMAGSVFFRLYSNDELAITITFLFLKTPHFFLYIIVMLIMLRSRYHLPTALIIGANDIIGLVSITRCC